jgi:hypothetical protein
VVIGERLIAASVFESGMTWAQYLDSVSRSHSMQIARYESITEEELERFQGFGFSAKAIILTGEKCGDGAWAVPRLTRLLEQNPSFELRYFFRDDFPELMDRMETNDKRAIPKLAILDDKFRVLGEWGPYPKPIQQHVNQFAGKVPRAEWYPEVMKYYRSSGAADLSNEIHELVSQARYSIEG